MKATTYNEGEKDHTKETNMRAIIFPKYGSPDVLQLTEVERPAPKDNQVLVKVLAASANPLDWHRMRGAPFLARLGEGLLKPKNPKLGADIAGRVEAVGSNVTEFQPGDAVFGVCSGSFAEYVCAAETKLALKPANLSFEAAAAVPVAAFTALQGLRDKGQIQPGQEVLINGASGGVGTFAVQFAKLFGAEVTGVCSTRNLDMVRSIGADHVVDYTQEDFTKNGQRYDLIYDAVGNRSVSDYKRALSPQGICVIAGFTTLPRLFEHIVVGRWVSRAGSKKIGLMGMAATPKEDLVVIKELLEAGKVVPVIDRCYPLGATAEAIRYLEQGHARGKVIIITLEDNNKT
jgi:NADPH:quinone reductase-like Zn-dependent oxidoreductase